MVDNSEFMQMHLADQPVKSEIRFRNNIRFVAHPCTSRASRGYTAIIVLFDELWFFMETGGVSSAKEVYSNLVPNIKPFGKDGKSVILTSVGGDTGFVYEKMTDTQKNPSCNTYLITKNTWEMNPHITFESLSEEFRKDETQARLDYGCEPLTNVDTALNRIKIEEAAVLRIRDPSYGEKQHRRVLTLDPGLKHDTFALAMGYIDGDTPIIDYITGWTGNKDNPVSIEEVEEHITMLHKNFNIVEIALDQYQSASTVQRLGKLNYPICETTFTAKYNYLIYSNLIEKLNLNKIKICRHDTAIKELKVLRRVGTTGGGKYARYEAPTSGEIKHDDYCFVAGTKVLTDKCQIPIEKLRVGDRVMTRCGLKRITGVGSRYKEVIKKIGLAGTPNHPIITKNGIKSLKDLQRTDEVFLWSNQKLSVIPMLVWRLNTKEILLSDFQKQKREKKEYIIQHIYIQKIQKFTKHCIERFGKMHLVKFLKDVLFTIKMGIHSTINYPISNACLEGNINHIICKNQKLLLEQKKSWKNIQDLELENGINQKKERNGIRSRQKQGEDPENIFSRKNISDFVFIVKKNILHHFRLAQNIVRQSVIGAIIQKRKVRKVYNISVEGCNEYFVNNILVHNCDVISNCAYRLSLLEEFNSTDDFAIDGKVITEEIIKKEDEEKKAYGIKVEEPEDDFVVMAEEKDESWEVPR